MARCLGSRENEYTRSNRRTTVSMQRRGTFYGRVFSVGADPRLYNEDSRPAELELRESLEMAGEDSEGCEDIACPSDL
jgi:hypothetical protein